MADPRQNIAYTLAQRAAGARNARQAAMPAPAQRPTDPVTGGFLPTPRQGDALDQMYAQSAQRVRGQGGPPQPGQPPGFQPAFGPSYLQQPGAPQMNMPPQGPGGPPMPGGGGTMAGKGPGAGMPPPGDRSRGAVYDGPMGGTPAHSMNGPPPPGAEGMPPKSSAATMPAPQ